MQQNNRDVIEMKYRFILVNIFFLLLYACAVPKPPSGYDVSRSEASLAEASYSVSRSIVNLAEVAQAAHPLPDLGPPPNPATYGMGGTTSVDWSGPAEPLVCQMAKVAGYRVRVLGSRPAIPVLVNISVKNGILGDILRDIGYQCGRRATLVVYPESRVIELRYARN